MLNVKLKALFKDSIEGVVVKSSLNCVFLELVLIVSYASSLVESIKEDLLSIFLIIRSTKGYFNSFKEGYIVFYNIINYISFLVIFLKVLRYNRLNLVLYFTL